MKFISRSNHPKDVFIIATPLTSLVNKKHLIPQRGTQGFFLCVCGSKFLSISGREYSKLIKLLLSNCFKKTHAKIM